MRAVVLAGGRGTRLRPFTTSFPKPLMPLADVPILEILLRQLKANGVTQITLLTGHLAYLIEGYFGNGSSLGVHVDYVHEAEALGTAGPLRQLAGRVSGDFLVMNGDLLTDVDFTALMAAHQASGAMVTVSTCRRDERVELGVLTYGEDDRIVGYDEKPTLHLDVSMGLYAMRPEVLELIPAGYYDMPNLITDLLAGDHAVVGRRHDGFWLDIGRPDDYARAAEVYAANPEAFISRAAAGREGSR